MKWLKKKDESENVNYWQTISDVMSALLLIILLIMLLLILYVTLVPPNENIDDEIGNTFDEHLDDEHDVGDDWDDSWDAPYWIREREQDNNGGGGGGGNDHPQQEKTGDYEFDEEPGEKAAVYVRLIDGETGRIIRAPGIVFNLLSGGERVVLNTYYPERVSFEEYATTEEGVFYFPEKIQHGHYALRELSAPYGYEPSDNIEFSIDEEHDWDEPYILDVNLFPARARICLQAEDADTGEKIPGGSWVVYAAKDIITADGTLRVSAGQEVDRIDGDDQGYAQSNLLYPGEYRVEQSAAPEYYADVLQPVAVRLGRQDSSKSSVTTVACERTTFTLAVRDELYHDLPLSDAVFAMTEAGHSGTVELRTDAAGNIMLNQLRRGSTVTLTQIASADGYSWQKKEYLLSVDGTGRIAGQASASDTVYNRTLRIAVTIRDTILQNGVADCSVTLTRENGDIVRNWTSTAAAEQISGLTPGKYTIRVMSGGSAEEEIEILDMAELQSFSCAIWSGSSLIGVIALGVLAAAAVGGAGFAIARKRKKS